MQSVVCIMLWIVYIFSLNDPVMQSCLKQLCNEISSSIIFKIPLNLKGKSYEIEILTAWSPLTSSSMMKLGNQWDIQLVVHKPKSMTSFQRTRIGPIRRMWWHLTFYWNFDASKSYNFTFSYDNKNSVFQQNRKEICSFVFVWFSCACLTPSWLHLSLSPVSSPQSPGSKGLFSDKRLQKNAFTTTTATRCDSIHVCNKVIWGILAGCLLDAKLYPQQICSPFVILDWWMEATWSADCPAE